MRQTKNVRVPKKIYNRHKEMSEALGVPMTKSFEIMDNIYCEIVSKTKMRKKQRYVIDVKK